MSGQLRILVVENLDPLRQSYAIALKLAGFAVDGAGNLQQALDLIDSKTFHVALVDLMLRDPHDSSMEGLQVLERLRDLGEGTCSIVLSGQDEPQVAADTMTQYGAAYYVAKTKLLDSNGGAYLVDLVREFGGAVKIRDYGDSDSISQVLAGQGSAIAWVDRCVRMFQPEGGIRGFERFLDKFCRFLLPLIPRREVSQPMAIDQERKSARGIFWSKGLGLPLELVVLRAERMFQVQLENHDFVGGLNVELLRPAFEANGIAAPGDITVTTEVEDSQWCLNLGPHVYIAIRRGRILDVHLLEDAAVLVDGEIDPQWDTSDLPTEPYIDQGLAGYAFRLQSAARPEFVERI